MALRSFPGRRRLAVTVACLFMLAAHAAPAIARSNGWTLTRTPSAVTDSIASDISLTATNSNGGSSVGCVRLQIPSAFTVNLVAVDGASGSHVWTANPPASGGGGSTIVVVRAINNANRLTSNGESVTFHINVTGTPVGIYTWNGTSFNDAGCGSGADNGSVVVMVVPGGPPSNTPAAANDDGPYSVLAGVDLDVGGNAGVLANDTDADNDTLSAVADTSPAHGSLILGSDGGFTYSPDAGYTGPDSFTYRAFDGTANSAPATVTLTVTNSAPVAAVDAYTTPKNTPLVVAAGAGVIANDSDPDAGQTLTVSVAAGPAHGTLALNANGSFTYTPTSGYDGADGFTYSLSDGTATDSAAVGLTVVNGAPTATDDLYSGFKNIPLLIGGGSGLLANDSDPDGDGLTAAVVSPPSNGLLLLGANGGFTYTPALG
ncbi:MAG TPA: cadherin-like domain-containing protein, partial [Candidatus Limnocylindrales bacterium]|nr:cadherin-like domain-containing protein [Candidatus Limnocylindrales bacterium]